MKAAIKLYTNKETVKGFPVVLYLRYATVRKRINLGWYFKRDQWNFEKEEPLPATPDYRFIYPKLLNYKYQIKTLLYENVTDVSLYLKIVNIEVVDEITQLENRLAELKNKSVIGILQFFDVIIAEKKAKNESVRSYEGCKNQVKKYIKTDVPLNTVNYEWLNYFILFKKSQGTGIPGINTYLRVLRALYKEAQRRTSLNINRENPFTGLIKNVAAAEVVDFNVADFKKLQNYIPKKFTTKKSVLNIQQKIAVCLFQFAIGGHDLVDIANLKWQDVQKGRVKFKRYKNRNKPNGGLQINNLLVPEAKTIIKKFGTIKNERVFGFIPAPNEMNYIDYRNNFNRSLREICKDLKFKSTLKSKSTRYIFRSLAGELLVNDLVIMQLQGHKPQGVTFNYQKNLPTMVIDEYIVKIVTAANLMIV